MVLLSKFKEIFKYDAGKRLLKVLSIGGALTAKESAPFGVDSNPIANMTAVYAPTSNVSERVVIGYINKNQIAGAGESRLYSVDANGALQSYIWNKANGTLELNGNTYSAVRYQTLNTQLQSLITQINTQLPLIASGIATGGGTYTPTNVNVDFSGAESSQVKLK